MHIARWMSGRGSALLAACAAMVVGTSAWAQELARPAPDHPAPIPLRDMPVADLTGGIIAWLDVPANTREEMFLTIPTEHHKDLTLFLQPVSLLHATHEVREYTTPTEFTVVDVGPEKTYTGSVNGIEGSRVAVSILPDGLFAAIFLPDGSTVWVQPLSEYLPGAPRDMHVIYAGDDSSCGGMCDVPAGYRPQADVEGVEPGADGYNPRGFCAGPLCAALLAIDADFLYYQARGNSSFNVRDRVAAIVNVVNHQYQRDVSITHELGTFVIRTTAGADPYTSNNSQTLLAQFRDHWNLFQLFTPRDVAHLFTGRTIDGSTIGRAYLGVVCNTGSAYGFSQSDFSTNFACVTDLTAHELGHNWDAEHCTCTNSTMNPNITCTNTFENSSNPNSITQITTYRAVQSCLEPRAGLPSNNMCTSATRITGNGNWSINTTNATTDGGNTSCGSQGAGERDVWWVLTTPVAGTVNLNTCGSSFDTILSVHTGCPGTNANLVVCNDDSANCSPTTRSFVSFTAAQGSTYYIRVAGFNGANGTAVLNVSAPTFGNNTCASGTSISNGSNVVGSLFNFSSTGSSTCGTTSGNPDAWYTFTAPCNGTLEVNTCGSHDWQGNTDTGVDTVVSLHTACVGSTTNQITCNDDATIPGCSQSGAVRDSRVTAVVSRGDIVRVRVSHFGTTGFGNGMFRVRASFTTDPEPPVINTIPNQSVNCGSAFTAPTPTLTIPACMTPVTWSLVTAPTGVTINASTGVVVWFNPVIGTHTITIRATNSAGNSTRTFTLTVNRIAPVITSFMPESGTCGTTYTGPTPVLANPACMNPITSWQLVSGPAGMLINTTTGVVSWGNPVVGNHTVTIRANNSAGNGQNSFTLTILPNIPNISAISNATIDCGSAYTGPTPTLTNPACMSPVTWSLDASPAGMTINPTTGVVSWPAPTVGNHTITIRATNSLSFGQRSWTLAVNRLAPAINAISNATIDCGSPYTGPTPVLSNPACMAPATWSLVSAPQGMSINPGTGVVSWAGPVIGAHTITIRATNSAGTADRTWTVTINQLLPVLNPIPDQTAACTDLFTLPAPTFTNPACMGPATVWQLGSSAPPGMTINPATGAVSWPNPVAGNYTNILIRVTNARGVFTVPWNLTITQSAPLIVPIPTQTHTLPAPYTGPAPLFTVPRCMAPALNWQLAAGSPAGMTINPATGVVSWPAPQVGSFLVRIRVTTAAGSHTFDWTLNVQDSVACDPDVNCDGNVDQDDVACLAQAVAGDLSCLCVDPDFNGDGNVDQDDIDALAQVVAGAPCP